MTGQTATIATTAVNGRRVRTVVRTDEHISRNDVLREDLRPLNRTHAETCEIVLTLFVHSLEEEEEKERIAI
jgi:hypothetical protein